MVLATFPIRLIGIVLFSGVDLPPIVMRGLSLVPIAMLSAICAPLIFQPNNMWENPLTLAEFWALIAFILASRLGFLASILISLGVYMVGIYIR